MDFSTLTADWLAFRAKLAEFGQIAPSTYDKQVVSSRVLTRAFGHVPLVDLRRSQIEIWAASRRQTVAPDTLATELRLLRQILNWAVDEGFLAQRPKLPVVSVPNVETALPADSDFVWYLTNLAPRHADALEFMLLTGLAPHELARLQPRDMTPEGLFIGEREDFRIKTQARRRPVPLNDRAAWIWVQWSMGLNVDTPVFPKEGTLQKAMKRCAPPPGSSGITPKIMRRWFASMVAAEHSEAVLQRLMGHAPGSRVTRRHYTRTNVGQLERAVAGLEISVPK